VLPSIFCHILLLHFVFTDVQLRDVHLSQAEKEPILSSFLYASVLSHDCLEQALGFVLANRLEDPTLLATQLIDIFNDVMMNNKDICRSIRFDAQVSNCYLCNSPFVPLFIVDNYWNCFFQIRPSKIEILHVHNTAGHYYT
jgi:hypothetical protein